MTVLSQCNSMVMKDVLHQNKVRRYHTIRSLSTIELRKNETFLAGNLDINELPQSYCIKKGTYGYKIRVDTLKEYARLYGYNENRTSHFPDWWQL